MNIIYLEIEMLHKKGELKLPIHYNYIVQSAIYNSINQELAEFLHQRGYMAQNIIFKLFTFSRLTGQFKLNKNVGTISFINEVKLVISSPVADFCQSLVNTLLTRGMIKFGSTEMEVIKVFAKKTMVEKEQVKLDTLSPVVIYSTLLRPDGRKYTCYFQPGEPDYNLLLTNNLRKKYQAFNGNEPPAGEVKVKSLGKQKMHLINYKGIVIKGYSGKMLLTGPKELLQLGVDSGLGSKNSQGFGCVRVKEEI